MITKKNLLTDIITTLLLFFCIVFSFFYYFKLKDYYFKPSKKRISAVFFEEFKDIPADLELSRPYVFKYGTVMFHGFKNTDKGFHGDLTVSGEYRYIHRMTVPKIIIIKTKEFSLKGIIVDEHIF